MSIYGKSCYNSNWLECLAPPTVKVRDAITNVLEGAKISIYEKKLISKNRVIMKAIAEDNEMIGFIFAIFPKDSLILISPESCSDDYLDIVIKSHFLSEEKAWNIFKRTFGESYVLFDEQKDQLMGHLLYRVHEFEIPPTISEALITDAVNAGHSVTSWYRKMVIVTRPNGKFKVYQPITDTLRLPHLHLALNNLSFKEGEEFTYTDRGYEFWHAMLSFI